MERYRAMANEMRGGSAATDAGPPAQAFEQAVQFQKQGRTREAEELYLAVLGQEPEHLDALHNLGLLRLEAGNPSEAEVLLARVLAKAPQSPRLLNNYGVALDSLKRHEVAIKYFARALQLSPDYAECHNNIGNALQMLGRHDDALRHYQLALTLKPDYVDAHRNLGRALLNIANVYRARAIAHFEKSLSLKPQDAEAYCGLGIAHQALNQFDNAVTFLAKAIAIDPQHVEARQQLALTTSIAQQSSRPAAQTIGGAGRFTLQLADEPRESGRMPDRTSKLEDAIDVRDGREAHG